MNLKKLIKALEDGARGHRGGRSLRLRRYRGGIFDPDGAGDGPFRSSQTWLETCYSSCSNHDRLSSSWGWYADNCLLHRSGYPGCPTLDQNGYSQSPLTSLFSILGLSQPLPARALAAYAGAGIAGAPPMKTGLIACKMGLAAFIIPYMFVYGPSMLAIGSVTTIL